tara:strand:- start:192 stop:356 length:165 start_codon:yes stop_codon:yes gene_type:complete
MEIKDLQEDKLVVRKMACLAVVILLFELLLALISIYIGSMYPYFQGDGIIGLII